MIKQKLVARYLFLFWVIVFLIGCAGAPLELGERHKDNGGMLLGIDSYEGLSFSNYIQLVSDAIKKYDGLARNEEELVKVFPFQDTSSGFNECKEDQVVGILLIHGLTDTPYLLRDLSRSLVSNQSCIITRAIVLPGHATTPGNLLNIEYNDWVAATEYGVNSFIESGIENIFIAGFSTGGALALNYLMSRDNKTDNNIRGLLLFSPAIRIKPRGGFLANWHYLVSWIDPKRAWFDILHDEDFSKYESFPKNAADQVYLLTTKNIGLNGKPLSTPIFTVISEDDETINSQDTIAFFENRASANSNLIVYKRNPNSRTDICDLGKRVCEKNSVYPKYNVESFSHTAIPISVSNDHYGFKGDYRSCSHYLVERNQKEYDDCKGSHYQWGEKNLEGLAVRRLTFNPDFDSMAQLATQFVRNHK